MDIRLPEYPERGGSSRIVVDSHGVSVSFGSFTSLDLTDMDLHIEGAAELERLCAPYVAEARKLVQPELQALVRTGPDEMWGPVPERELRDSLPKKYVQPLRDLALKLALEFFSKHPHHFVCWLKEREERAFQKGRQVQAGMMRKSLMLDGEDFDLHLKSGG